TGMPPSAAIASVEIEMANDLKATAGWKPNIFLFVIDSLRKDYLSPYNDAVDFTPGIQSFARESVVMQNAFTRYGGTALAEPSIWIGGMLPHRRYGMNIYSMNALQKLIDTEAYEKFVNVDRVLRFVLRSAVSTVELDKGLLRGEVENRSDYLADFSTTLRELQGKLDMRGDVSQPIFAYAQPKNLHILVCYEADVPPGEEYPGFYAPYAARVRRVDASFGRFIEYLKARGLYNDSVVILTSDHGDALGEGGGRWGHSNWVFPEIIRVPLIIHLPSRLAKAFHCD